MINSLTAKPQDPNSNAQLDFSQLTPNIFGHYWVKKDGDLVRIHPPSLPTSVILRVIKNPTQVSGRSNINPTDYASRSSPSPLGKRSRTPSPTSKALPTTPCNIDLSYEMVDTSATPTYGVIYDQKTPPNSQMNPFKLGDSRGSKESAKYENLITEIKVLSRKITNLWSSSVTEENGDKTKTKNHNEKRTECRDILIKEINAICKQLNEPSL